METPSDSATIAAPTELVLSGLAISEKRTRSLVAILAACLSIVAAADVARASAEGARASEHRVDVGGHELYLRCAGTGSPTVVLNSGAGGWSIFYREIQDRVASVTRICAADPAGSGESDPGPDPLTPGRAADQLHRLLHGAGIEPPYVVAGHSFGGLTALVYQRRYATDVASVVLVESAHPEQWTRLPAAALAAVKMAVPQFEALAKKAEAGALTDADVQQRTLPSPELTAAYRRAMKRPHTYRALADLYRNIESGMEEVPMSGMADTPLVVVSAGNSFASFAELGIPIEEANRVWDELQDELAGLSTDAIRIVSEAGTHDLHTTDPDAVVRGIERGVELARRASRSDDHGPATFHRLPLTSDASTDALLREIEEAYRSMDVDDFVTLFAQDVEQLDVNRRVLIRGRDAWRAQTLAINGAHRWMERVHHGRLRVGDVVVVEVEWAGVVRGEALPAGGEDRGYRYSGLGILELGDDGRVASQIFYGDFVTLAAQLELEAPSW